LCADVLLIEGFASAYWLVKSSLVVIVRLRATIVAFVTNAFDFARHIRFRFIGASPMQVNEWIFIGMFFVIAWVFPAMPLVAARLLQPKRPNQVKTETYECGIETIGDAWVQFKVQYYLYALVFLVFDIEMVFLFPWAVAYNQLGLFAFVEMLIFI